MRSTAALSFCLQRLVLVLVLLATFLFDLPNAVGAQEVLKGFDLKHCNSSSCFLLKTDTAVRSELDSIYAFARAKLTVLNRGSVNNSAPEFMFGSSGFYDPRYAQIVLRGLSKTGEEMILDLNAGEIRYFHP